MKKTYSIFCLTVAFSCACTLKAQTPTIGIDPSVMEQISRGYTDSPSDKALRNALCSTDLRKLIVNRDNLPAADMNFNIVVPSVGITDQKNSGRCWLFSSLNVLRAEMMSSYDLPEFEFSESFGQFYDLLEKSNSFLQNVIAYKDEPIDSRANQWLFKKPFGDGGHFANAANLIMKYGLVPKEVMPETNSSSNNLQLMNTVRTVLRGYGLKLRSVERPTPKKLQAVKIEALTDIYRILALNLGVPPTEFSWTRYDKKGNRIATKTYTPLTFYREFFDRDLRADYIMLMNDPTHDYYKLYEVDMNRNCIEGDNWRYVNLPMEVLEQIAVSSLRGGSMLYFSCDVDRYRIPEMGLLDVDCLDYESLLGVEFPMTKAERILSCESTSTHAMALAGVDVDENGNVSKWLVENSYGKDYGRNGYLVMTNRWFEEYMFRLVAEKKYVPSEIVKLTEGKSIVLPAWNPTF